MNLKFIDTPGYRDSYCQKQWFKMIKSYIIGKVIQYLIIDRINCIRSGNRNNMQAKMNLGEMNSLIMMRE